LHVEFLARFESVAPFLQSQWFEVGCCIKLSKKDQTNIGVTTENIRELIEGENSRLTRISISDSYIIKQLVFDLSSDFLQKRKRQF
jgi:hypothetical protein